MPSSSALPLNVTPASTPANASDQGNGTNSKASTAATKQTGALNPSNISSPHELTAFVEKLIDQLDSKFDEMSTQILDRMSQMSNRVDSLEASIQDIINGDSNE